MVSVFDGAKGKDAKKSVPLLTVLEGIKSGTHRKQIEEIRRLYQAEGKGDGYTSLKKTLLAFTVSGLCSERKKPVATPV